MEDDDDLGPRNAIPQDRSDTPDASQQGDMDLDDSILESPQRIIELSPGNTEPVTRHMYIQPDDSATFTLDNDDMWQAWLAECRSAEADPQDIISQDPFCDSEPDPEYYLETVIDDYEVLFAVQEWSYTVSVHNLTNETYSCKLEALANYISLEPA